MESAAMQPAWPWGGPAEPGAGADPREPAAEPGSHSMYFGYPMRNGTPAEQAGWHPSGPGYAGSMQGAYQALLPSSALGMTPRGDARSPWDGTQSTLTGLRAQAAQPGALPERSRWGLQAAPLRNWGAGLGWQQRPGWTQGDAAGCALTS